jgi:hypothetical protein
VYGTGKHMVDLDPKRAETALHVSPQLSNAHCYTDSELVLVVLRAILHPFELHPQGLRRRIPSTRDHKTHPFLDHPNHHRWYGSVRWRLPLPRHVPMQARIRLVEAFSRLRYLSAPKHHPGRLIHCFGDQLHGRLDFWNSSLLHRPRS